MRDIAIRSLSGILYVFLIVGAAWVSQTLFLSIISIFSGLALLEYQRLQKVTSLLPYLFLMLLWVQSVFHFLPNLITALLLPIVVGINLYLAFALFQSPNRAFSKQFSLLGAFFYLAGSSYFILALTHIEPELGVGPVLFVYASIWVNNSFAYLVGRLFGKTPLFPSISPKKTWEGFFGGLVFTLLLSYYIAVQQTDFSIAYLLLMGSLIAIFATVGDLVQSKFKRLAAVKDSGSLIPGHGGFFDRMDSVLFSAPLIYAIYLIFSYVS